MKMMYKSLSILTGLLLLSFCVALGQTISGPTNVCAGSTVTYTVTGLHSQIGWSVEGGTLLSEPDMGSISVRWGTSGGTVGVIGAKDRWGDAWGSDEITVRVITGGVASIGPSSSLSSGGGAEESVIKDQTDTGAQAVTPASVSGMPVVTVCGGSYSGMLTLSGFAGPILRWEYRHDASTWQPIYHTGATYSFSATQTTFFRAVVGNTSCTLYSQTATLYFPNVQYPVVADQARCGAGTVPLQAYVKDAESYRWYASQYSNDVLSMAATYEPYLTQSAGFWVSAVIKGCEGPRSPVYATVNPLPNIPDVGIDRRYSCGQTKVNVPLVAPQGETYYWQNSDIAAHFTANAPTSTAKTLTSSGRVYFNAMFNDTGCFGPVESHDVVVYPTAPAPAAPGIKSENCGSTTLRSDPPTVPRTLFYWQTQPDGKSRTHAGEITVTTSGTYYLRSAFFDEDCWSAPVPLQVTIRRSACIEEQASTQNYVITHAIQREGVSAASQVPYLTAAENTVVVAYSDGLGRISQSITLEGSPSRNDIVQAKAYDARGNEPKIYLPYARWDSYGKFREAALQELQLFYSEPYAAEGKRAGTTAPWTETVFEASPVNRVKEKGAAGEVWQPGNKTVRYNLQFNTQYQVLLWYYDPYTGRCQSQGFYDEGTLTMEETIDENGFKAWNFRDRNGSIVMSRLEVSATEVATTYYVFDAFRNLRMVIQPEGVKQLLASGSWSPDDAFVDRWCFTYSYDRYGRLTEKKAPGAAPVYHVYNKRNQLILTQDGEQRRRNEWMFTKYDDLKRVVMTGIYKHPADISQPDMQQLAYTHQGIFERRAASSTAGAMFGYTVTNSFPELSAGNAAVHVVNYFDDYNFDLDTTTPDPAYITSGMSPEPVSTSRVTGKLTGTRVAMLPAGQFLLTVNFYDKHGRTIQTQHDHHAGGKEIITRRYDFTGKMLEEHLRHQTSASNATIRKWLTYDHSGRLLTVRQKVNNDATVTMLALAYNELGQLTDKKLHSTDGNNFLQTLDLRYNIRGWVSKINDAALSDPSDLFGMELLYNEAVRLNSTRRQHNGNIAELVYNDRLLNKQRGYGFTYDGLDRLTSASYRAVDAAGLPAEVNARNEEGIVYDLNGNIRNLARRRPEGDKLLSYTYNGNLLTGVTGNVTPGSPVPDEDDPRPEEPEENIAAADASAAPEQCTYDANGNLIGDASRGLTIVYNHLNLPAVITRQGKGQIRYNYDALGTRLSKSVTDSTGTTHTRTYVGAFEYGDGMTMEFFSTGEGRVMMKGATPEYQYYLKDHLGNVRVTFTATPATLTSVATLESANAGAEHKKFLYYDEAVKVNHTLFNHTGNTATKYATRLNGTSNERIGLAKSVSVMPGDVVKMEVFAKYLDTDRSQWSSALLTAMNAIAAGTAPAGTVVDGGAAGSIGNQSFPLISLLDKSSSGGSGPKAFLNYMVFDRSFKYRDGGFVQVTENAKENGTGVTHERLAHELTITEPGYVYIFLSNENETPVEVYFDDFSITQVQSSIVSGEEYYPFGSTFNSFTRENSTPQLYQFNGKERETALDLNWDNFGARMYDPEIARWLVADPMADKMTGWSPYNFSFNNPVRFVDPDGRMPHHIYPAWEYYGGIRDYREQTQERQKRQAEFEYKFFVAMTHLKSNGADLGIFDKLEALGIKWTLQEAINGSRVTYEDPSHPIVQWDPTEVLVTDLGYKLSPAENLMHELGHLLQQAEDPVARKMGTNIIDKYFTNMEEKRNITFVEYEVARRLGKLKEGEVTRMNHNAKTAHHTSDPTTTEKDKKLTKEMTKLRMDFYAEDFDPRYMYPQRPKKKEEEEKPAPVIPFQLH